MNSNITLDQIQEVIRIKNKVNDHDEIKKMIFQRHNITDFNKNEFIFKRVKNNYQKMIMVINILPILMIIISFIKGSLFLFSLSLIISFLTLITYVVYDLFINHNSLIMCHEDYVDLSKVLQKEEIKTIVEFYKENGIKGQQLKGDYLFNIADLYDSFEADDSIKPEVLKVIKGTKFDNYLSSLY